MVSQAVEEEDAVDFNPYPTDPLSAVLVPICRRENRRQTLDISPEKQMSTFEELFRETEGAITPQQLEEYVQVICDVSDPGVLTRFQNHFFLRRDSKGTLVPRYDVLRTYFIARFLANGLVSKDTPILAKCLASVSESAPQVFDWVANQLSRHPEDRIREAFAHAVRLLASPENLKLRKRGGLALSNLAIRRIQAAGLSKSECTMELCQLLSPDTLAKHAIHFAYFSGVLKGFDFSSWTLSGCHFSSVVFRNCSFSSGTTFTYCTFEGDLAFESCAGRESIIFAPSCTLSKEAELHISELLGQAPRAELLRAFAQTILEKALRKFRGTFGFQSVKYVNRLSGMPQKNPFLHKIWEALLDERIIEKHRISNVTEGGLNVVDDPTVRREIMALIDNDTSGVRLNRVITRLLTS